MSDRRNEVDQVYRALAGRELAHCLSCGDDLPPTRPHPWGFSSRTRLYCDPCRDAGAGTSSDVASWLNCLDCGESMRYRTDDNRIWEIMFDDAKARCRDCRQLRAADPATHFVPYTPFPEPPEAGPPTPYIDEHAQEAPQWHDLICSFKTSRRPQEINVTGRPQMIPVRCFCSEHRDIAGQWCVCAHSRGETWHAVDRSLWPSLWEICPERWHEQLDWYPHGNARASLPRPAPTPPPTPARPQLPPPDPEILRMLDRWPAESQRDTQPVTPE